MRNVVASVPAADAYPRASANIGATDSAARMPAQGLESIILTLFLPPSLRPFLSPRLGGRSEPGRACANSEEKDAQHVQRSEQ